VKGGTYDALTHLFVRNEIETSRGRNGKAKATSIKRPACQRKTTEKTPATLRMMTKPLHMTTPSALPISHLPRQPSATTLKPRSIRPLPALLPTPYPAFHRHKCWHETSSAQSQLKASLKKSHEILHVALARQSHEPRSCCGDQ